jgi:hypothetical protein
MSNNPVHASPPQEFARCRSCEVIHQWATAYVEGRPSLAARLGPDIAVERIESVLVGLAVLGQPVPDDLGLVLPRLHPAAHALAFSNPLTLTTGMCSPRPWAHVTTGQRAALRKAYAESLRDRLALSSPPVPVPCPSGGCLLCGVASVERSAIEVARRGGVEAAGVWTFWTVPPVALGGAGPDLIGGHTCPDCTRAIEEDGAVGWPARAQALVSHLSSIGEDKKADRLRRECEGDFPPRLPAWRADPKARPSAQPWAHLRRVIDRL